MVRRRNRSSGGSGGSSRSVYPFSNMLYVKQLCMPALLYFSLGLITTVFSALRSFMIGSGYMLSHHALGAWIVTTALYTAFHLFYVLFWTYILQLICKDGHSGIVWLLVLFPLVVHVMLIFMLL